MSDRSAVELEQDAELARTRVADTAESIRAKMSPGQLIDEVAGLFSGSGDGSALSTLRAQVNQNPLALALVGAGVGWLMLGNNGVGAEGSVQTSRRDTVPTRPSAFHDQYPWPADDVTEQANELIGERASKLGETVSSMAGEAVASVKDAVLSAGERATSATSSAASGASNAASGALDSAQDLLTREPLMLAALGLALGTAIGAVLPHTRIEDEQLGDLSGKIRDKAMDVLDKGLEGAKDVAADVYVSVKDAADEEFGAADSGNVADKVSSVVKAVASETEETIRQKVATTD